MRGVRFTFYLICAGEFKIVKDWEINVHHYEAHSDNASHNIQILYTVDINLGRRSQQRDSRDETKTNYAVLAVGIGNSFAKTFIDTSL